jgi:drug/metabolite transporter (DMT)-like permease
MRHGQATGVTSLLYLTPPVAALVEWAVFRVPPTATMWIGMAIACVGVAMATVGMARVTRGTLVEERS